MNPFPEDDYREFNVLTSIDLRKSQQKTHSPCLVDAFDAPEPWNKFISNNEYLTLVISPEIHNNPHLELWEMLKTKQHENIYLCTDFPDKAYSYFMS